MNEIDDSTTSVAEVHLNPTPTAPGDARRFVTDVLDGHASIEPAKLIVSELVTNAVLHGGRDAGRVTVVVQRDIGHGRVRLEVSQSKHHGFLYPDQEPGHLGPTGRGLMIVDAIASDWGIDDDTGTVWVVLA
jgi:anti-sigma regulatory factor (Ser/Thr protein kinase)